MKTNVGYTDRVLRMVIGVAILGSGYACQSWWGLVGLIPIVTAIIRFCPAYLPFGFSTCAREDTSETDPSKTKPE